MTLHEQHKASFPSLGNRIETWSLVGDVVLREGELFVALTEVSEIRLHWEPFQRQVRFVTNAGELVMVFDSRHPTPEYTEFERVVLRRFRELHPAGVVRARLPVGHFVEMAIWVGLGVTMLWIGLLGFAGQQKSSDMNLGVAAMFLVGGLAFLRLAGVRRNRLR